MDRYYEQEVDFDFGRKLRRYHSRWIIERTFSWLHNCRRLITRQKYYPESPKSFVHFGLSVRHP